MGRCPALIGTNVPKIHRFYQYLIKNRFREYTNMSLWSVERLERANPCLSNPYDERFFPLVSSIIAQSISGSLCEDIGYG
jgi:hypothetical protein